MKKALLRLLTAPSISPVPSPTGVDRLLHQLLQHRQRTRLIDNGDAPRLKAQLLLAAGIAIGQQNRFIIRRV